MPFKNFSIWRGRLPHWRADDVVYYVTFRYRRALTAPERILLLKALLRPDGRSLDLDLLWIGEESAELIFRVRESAKGEAPELSKVIERAKAQAGRAIQKRTEERYPPFYGESYDRIIRDDAELEEKFRLIAEAVDDGAYLYARES